MTLTDLALFYIYRYRVLSPEQLRVLIAYDRNKDTDAAQSPTIKGICTKVLHSLTDKGLIQVMQEPTGHPRLPCPVSYVPTRAGCSVSRKMMAQQDAVREVAARLPARAYRPPLSPEFFPHQYYLNEFLVRFNTMLSYNIPGSVCWNDNFVLERQDLRPDGCVYIPPCCGYPKTYFFIENDMSTMSCAQNREKFHEYGFMFNSFFWDPEARYIFLFVCNDMSYRELADKNLYNSYRMHRQTKRRIDNIRRDITDEVWTYLHPEKHIDFYADNHKGIMEVVRDIYLPQYTDGISAYKPVRRDEDTIAVDYRHCLLNGVRDAYEGVRKGKTIHIRCSHEKESKRFWHSFGDYFKDHEDSVIFEFSRS